jgi:chromosome segregation ATPase
VLSRLGVPLTHVALLLVCVSSQALGQETQSPQPKKIWTNDELNQIRSEGAPGTQGTASANGLSQRKTDEQYRREKDPHWYVKQLHPLQKELATVEQNLRSLSEAQRSGKGGTSSVNLDQLEEGVTTQEQLKIFQTRRAQLVKRIDDLEEQARHNGIEPGELREGHDTEEWSSAENADAESEVGVERAAKKSRVVTELEEQLTEERKHLEDANKEMDLLRREQKLEEMKEFSSPEPRSRRDPAPRLAKISSEMLEKDSGVQELEHRITELEDRLEDVKRRPTETGKQVASGNDLTGQLRDSNSDETQKDEAFWRKQFSEIDYRIRMATSELAILRREHNVLLMQYYANPTTALKESVTRRDINKHRTAIEGKQKELTQLKSQREDLEDALRHAGGPPAWAR